MIKICCLAAAKAWPPSPPRRSRRLSRRTCSGCDGLRAAADCRRHDVPVVFVREPDPGLQSFPSGHERVLEGFAHVGEPLVHIDSGVDFLDGIPGFSKDPLRP